MKLIRPSLQIVQQNDALFGGTFLEDKLTNEQLKRLEHNTVYLRIDDSKEFDNYLHSLNEKAIQISKDEDSEFKYYDFYYFYHFFMRNPFSDCTLHTQPGTNGYITITTNMRVIKENNFGFLLTYKVNADNQFAKRRTIKLSVNLEFLRTLLSFRLMSTTFDILWHTYLIPDSMDLITAGKGEPNDILKLCNSKLKDKKVPEDEYIYFMYLKSLATTESMLSEYGKYQLVPSETAMYLLPGSNAVDVTITAFDYDWEELIRKCKEQSGNEDFDKIIEELSITLNALKYTDYEDTKEGSADDK